MRRINQTKRRFYRHEYQKSNLIRFKSKNKISANMYQAAINLLDNNVEAIYYERSDYLTRFFRAKDGFIVGPDKNNIWFEMEALQLRLLGRFDGKNDDFPSKAFGSYASFQDKNCIWHHIPNLRGFVPKNYTYYKMRMYKTKSNFMKARYADILWDQKGDYGASLIAIEAYLDISKTLFQSFLISEKQNDPKYGLEIGLILTRALTIAASISNIDLLKRICLECLTMLEQFRKCNGYRWYLDIIEAVVNIRNISAYVELNDFLSYANEAIKHYESIKNYHFVREFSSLKQMLNKLIGVKDLDAINKIGESYILEAELRLQEEKPSHHGAAIFYEDALNYYKSIGDSAKVEELKKKIKFCYEQARKNNEYQRFESKIEIKKEVIDSYLNRFQGATIFDILMFIGSDSDLRPSMSDAKSKAEEDRKKYVFMNLLTPIRVRDDNPSVKMSREDNAVISNFKFDYKFKLLIITHILERLKRDYNLKKEDVISVLSSSPFLLEEIPYISTAIDAYFKKEYISFLYILVPRIENILRGFIRALNIATTVSLSGIQERTLDSLLNEEALKRLFGEDMIYLLNHYLVDKKATNLRHDLSHGLLKAQHCDLMTSNMILYFYIFFATYGLESREG